jgi:hypothetical protein
MASQFDPEVVDAFLRLHADERKVPELSLGGLSSIE